MGAEAGERSWIVLGAVFLAAYPLPKQGKWSKPERPITRLDLAGTFLYSFHAPILFYSPMYQKD